MQKDRLDRALVVHKRVYVSPQCLPRSDYAELLGITDPLHFVQLCTALLLRHCSGASGQPL